jgi:hypothetical protein
MAVHSTQAQLKLPALLPGSKLNDPHQTEDPAKYPAEESKYVLPYLLEKSPEFRDLSDMRQQVNYTDLGYHKHNSDNAADRDGKPQNAMNTPRTFFGVRMSPTEIRLLICINL